MWNLHTLDCEFHTYIGREAAGTPTSAGAVAARGLLNLPHPNLIATWGDAGVCMWRIQHLHTHHTAVNKTVVALARTEAQGTPARVLARCADGSALVVSPRSGAIVTSLGPAAHAAAVVDGVFMSARDQYVQLRQDGSLDVYDCRANPMALVAAWPAPANPRQRCVCLRGVEHSAADAPAASWRGTVDRALAGGWALAPLRAALASGRVVVLTTCLLAAV